MIDYDQTIQQIISSIKKFSFEFDIEEVKRKMELREVSSQEIENLGPEKVAQNFSNGTFKIRQPNGNIIDSAAIYKHSAENNISEPFIVINPDFKYVRWELNETTTINQVKTEIRNHLSNNTEINLDKITKALIEEEIKNQKVEGFINDLPIKVSSSINEGKFTIQSSCTRETAIKLITEVVNDLKEERAKYVKVKINNDRLSAVAYLIFVLLVLIWWIFNNQNLKIEKWLSTAIGAFLFLVPFILRLFNFSFIDAIFFESKARKKYEIEFNNKTW